MLQDLIKTAKLEGGFQFDLWTDIETKCEITAGMVTFLLTGRDSYPYHINPSQSEVEERLGQTDFLRINIRGDRDYFPGHSFCVVKDGDRYILIQSYFNEYRAVRVQFNHAEIREFLAAWLRIGTNIALWESLTGVKLRPRERYGPNLQVELAIIEVPARLDQVIMRIREMLVSTLSTLGKLGPSDEMVQVLGTDANEAKRNVLSRLLPIKIPDKTPEIQAYIDKNNISAWVL